MDAILGRPFETKVEREDWWSSGCDQVKDLLRHLIAIPGRHILQREHHKCIGAIACQNSVPHPTRVDVDFGEAIVSFLLGHFSTYVPVSMIRFKYHKSDIEFAGLPYNPS